ncbi:MAG: methyltransferase domain-containing protein [Verrucomicrobia bacterium]|nr:methyltransferase domain-containing protein [Verrucomicrobiota bacterium]
MNRWLQLAQLNARVAGLALAGRWLDHRAVAADYDHAAPTYERVWLSHLRQTTDDLLQRLPVNLPGRIFDLGCGTGYVARRLAAAHPQATITAVDISDAMLNQARGQADNDRLTFITADMLAFARRQPAESAALIVSTWALGYSHPARLFRACQRLLPGGARLAFIVNYADTLAPVFRAFQRTMLRFPSRVRLAARPHFPPHWPWLERTLTRSQFTVEWHEDRELRITPPPGELLPWLRQTGILAGFDAMLDFSAAAGAFFEAELAPHRSALAHHFAMAIARRL